MGRKYPPCIVCGKIAKEIKLPNGSIPLCTDQACLDELNYMTNGKAIPIVWFSMDDLIEHEVVDEEIIKHFAGDMKTAMDLAQDVQSNIWGGSALGEMFSDALNECAGPELEKRYVTVTKDKDLPLIPMDSLKSEEAKSLLEKRLKGSQV